MASVKKTFDAVMRGQGMIAFRDLQRLLEQLGFRLQRISGSHYIYLHPKVTRPINIQRMGKDAKPYQVRQVRDIVQEFELALPE